MVNEDKLKREWGGRYWLVGRLKKEKRMVRERFGVLEAEKGNLGKLKRKRFYPMGYF